MEERCENSPAGVELVVSYEVRVVSLESVQDE